MAFLSILAGLAGIWFLAVTIPGPNFIIISRSSMAQSGKAGFFVTLGVAAGACIWATASIVGLKALFEYAGWLYDSIRILGGIYLVWMGVKAIRNTFQLTEENGKGNNNSFSPFKSFRTGILTSFSNPKTAVFFGSIFLTIFPPEAPLWAFGMAICIIFSISVGWYGSVAFIFSLPRIQARYLKFQRRLDKITGSLLILLGIKLAFSRS